MKTLTAEQATEFLTRVGVRPTANRILVSRALADSTTPLSLTELEDLLHPMEKSSVYRVLMQLVEHDAVHVIEDGRGIAKYELCDGHDHGAPGHMHAHFYCENCHNTICLDDESVPEVKLPEGYELRSVNFMVKGLCSECASKLKTQI